MTRYDCGCCDKFFGKFNRLQAHAREMHAEEYDAAVAEYATTGGKSNAPSSDTSEHLDGMAGSDVEDFEGILKDTSISARRKVIAKVFFNGDTRSPSWLLRVLSDARVNEFDCKMIAQAWFKDSWENIQRQMKLEAQASGQPVPLTAAAKGPSELEQMTKDFKDMKEFMRESMQMRAMQNMMSVMDPKSTAMPDPSRHLQEGEKVHITVDGVVVKMAPQEAVAYKQWQAEQERKREEAEERRQLREQEREERRAKEKEEERRRTDEREERARTQVKKKRLINGNTLELTDDDFAMYLASEKQAEVTAQKGGSNDVRDMVQGLRDEMHKRELQSAEERRAYEARLLTVQRDQQLADMQREIQQLRGTVANQSDGIDTYIETKARLQKQGLEGVPLDEKKLGIEAVKVERSLDIAERALASAQGKGDMLGKVMVNAAEIAMKERMRETRGPPAARGRESRYIPREEPAEEDVYDHDTPVPTSDGGIVLPTGYGEDKRDEQAEG